MTIGALEMAKRLNIKAKHGLPDHFSKPFNVNSLLAAVNNALAAPE